MLPVAVQACVFAPNPPLAQSAPPVPTESWFKINNLPVIVTDDIGTWVGPLSSGPTVVAGTSHWKVNNKSMVRLGIDSASPLSVLATTGQGSDYFSA